jgi:hypothetical protein
LFDSIYQTIQYPREKLNCPNPEKPNKIQYQATSFSFLFYETINRPIEKPVLLKNQNQFLRKPTNPLKPVKNQSDENHRRPIMINHH